MAQLAQALPGGDPLAVAIAAGETPSPEMVAAAGSTEGLRPWIAWTCLIFTILSLGTTAVLALQFSILDKVSIEKPPEVMVQTARDFLEDLGYTDTPGDSAILFEADENYLNYVFENNRSPNRFKKIPALTIQFAYRQSPKLLGVTDPFADILNDPPFRNPGESIVWLDSQERLIGLRIIPPVEHVQADSIQPPNWSLLFEAAGLNEDNFDPAETESIPPVYDDIRAAWTGTLPDFPGTEIRIEAAAWQGRPVFWRMIVPSWDNLSTAALDSDLAPGVGNDRVPGVLRTTQSAHGTRRSKRGSTLGRFHPGPDGRSMALRYTSCGIRLRGGGSVYLQRCLLAPFCRMALAYVSCIGALCAAPLARDVDQLEQAAGWKIPGSFSWP